jgi:sigma-B regulation protein RsbU (phosphoserine phosphatase)
MRFPKLFMTMAIGKICGSSMVIAGAGMPPALMVRAGSSTVARVPLKGIPLGAGFNGGYSAQTIPLSAGDVIVLMSDGLPELFNAQDIMLGYETLERELLSASSGRAADILARLLECAEQWRNGEPIRDDITLLVMKINPADPHGRLRPAD